MTEMDLLQMVLTICERSKGPKLLAFGVRLLVIQE